jgi:hypothetical protein
VFFAASNEVVADSVCAFEGQEMAQQQVFAGTASPPPRVISVGGANLELPCVRVSADVKFNKMQGLVRAVLNVKDSTDRRLQVS